MRHVSKRVRELHGINVQDAHLDHGVWGPEELDEAGDDSALDNLLDRRVALLGKELAELGRAVELGVDAVRENAGDHLWQLLVELSEGDSWAAMRG